MPEDKSPRIGIAGWSIPAEQRAFFPEGGSHLERYAEVFDCVEINSSFYRDHQPKTYRRWAETTPPGFRFAVKLYRLFTHDRRLTAPYDGLAETTEGFLELGEKLGAVLVQLPPSQELEPRTASAFFRELRRYVRAPIVLEPRHTTWSGDLADRILREHDISRVQADPERCPTDFSRTANAIAYRRLHGTPVVYRSSYEAPYLRRVADEVRAEQERGAEPWIIFDNTTFGFSIENAIELKALLDVPVGAKFPARKIDAPGRISP
jgi:uncharacterized protein YecE (DUF72 family)